MEPFFRLGAALLLTVAAFSLTACSFDYREMLLTEEEKEQIPDISLARFFQRVYVGNEKLLELRGERLETFESRNIQEIHKLSFVQYDDQGAEYVSGSADFASRDLETDAMLLQGAVIMQIADSGTQIQGDEFLYSPRQDLIWAPNDAEVSIAEGDGGTMRGSGFVVDLLMREMRFDAGAAGTISQSRDE